MAVAAPHMSNQTTNIPLYAVIVAGGTGTRMNGSTPKQFLPLNGLPVIMHTINVFAASKYQPNLLVVLPHALHNEWARICELHSFDTPHHVIAGGQTRFHSVKNAIDSIKANDAIIAIHDAVRPLVAVEIIENAFDTAARNGNAVTAVKSRDSTRLLKNGVSEHLKRDEIYLVQTPQTFKIDLLRNAYKQDYISTFTDDASVVENTGEIINLIDGSYSNIKITFPDDIIIAEALQKKPPFLRAALDY